MPRIVSFNTVQSEVPDHPRMVLVVRIGVHDAGEARDLLNRVHTLVGEATPSAETVLNDLTYAREERAAIQAEASVTDAPTPKPKAEPKPLDRDEREEKRRDAEEARIAAEATKPPRTVEGRPGLNPAAAFAEYEAQSAEGGQEPFAGYKAGDKYDGVEVLRVQTSKKNGFGVVTLMDGTKVKFDIESGHELGRKGGPAIPAGTHVDIEPTSRMSGLRAPTEDTPQADTSGTPTDETPSWMVPVVEAETLKAACAAALTQIAGADLPDWAVKMRDKVPMFGKVAATKLKARVERQVLALAPKEAASA